MIIFLLFPDVVKDIKVGEKLTKDNVRAIRPGLGLAPKYYEIIMGRTVAQDVKKGAALTWNLMC